ncbi:hypothetical protein ACFE04_024181 [Oxalis oulophora]
MGVHVRTGSGVRIRPTVQAETHDLKLVHQSSNSKFFKSTAGEDYKGVSGFYQCRMDLSSKECYKCVKKLTELSCHGSASGRIQLPGCYIHYEADDDTPPSSVYKNFIAYRKTELLHKSCGKAIEDDIIGFENMRDYALLEVENGAMEYGHSEVSYELVHAMAQCEEGFVGCDCGECVTNGVQIVVQDCATSNVGEVYLDNYTALELLRGVVDRLFFILNRDSDSCYRAGGIATLLWNWSLLKFRILVTACDFSTQRALSS